MHCFDRQVEILTESNQRIMYNIKDGMDSSLIDQNVQVKILLRRGRIVMTARNWRGKLIPYPSRNRDWIFHDDRHLT